METGEAHSDDLNYDQLNPVDVTVTVLDDDSAGIRVTPTSLAISEPDGADVFTVTLNTEPTAQVSLDLSLSSGECSVSANAITLDAANWNDGVVVTVMAVNDALDDDVQICLVQTGFSSSTDSNYDSLDPLDVTVTVEDDDAVYWVYLPVIINRWPPTLGVPSLSPIDNADGNGSYTVGWSAPAQAETYILQEARNSSFSDATIIYSGPSTNHAVSGRGAARYYYRVKASNIWTVSDWSNVRQVDVLWEAEPNDEAPEQANGPIMPNLVYYGTFLNGDDVDDYYFFDLTTARRVSLWLTNIPSGQNYDLILRDASLTVKGYSGNLSNSDEYIRTDNDAADWTLLHPGFPP